MQKEPTSITPPLKLDQGYMIDLLYHDVEQMERDDDNWEHRCHYQLHPGALQGRHRVLQLRTMQIAFAERPIGGMMYRAETAKGCMTFGMIETCSGKVCLARTKLRPGEIVFFDDTQPYHFLSSGAVRLFAVNIRHSRLGGLLPLMTRAKMKIVKDTDREMSATLHSIWEHFFIQGEKKSGTDAITHAEEKILSLLRTLLTHQEPSFPALTSGEAAAFAVREKLLRHMDGRFSIAALAEEFHVTEKTLQNGFKSAFGFPPLQFIRMLKLNHVYHELMQSDPSRNSVSETAQKWGFSHMGRFSHYYRELFGEPPSKTLKMNADADNALSDSCALRQEAFE